MKIEDIKPNGIYILKTKLNECNGETTITLFVRVFSIDLRDNIVQVHLISQATNSLFCVTPEKLFKSEDL